MAPTISCCSSWSICACVRETEWEEGSKTQIEIENSVKKWGTDADAVLVEMWIKKKSGSARWSATKKKEYPKPTYVTVIRSSTK